VIQTTANESLAGVQLDGADGKPPDQLAEALRRW